jgi:hypothetical protein
MKKNIFGVIIILFLGWIFYAFAPLNFILFSGKLDNNYLLVFTNEAEARPCGGFATAYGVGQIFPPKISIKNSFHLSSKTTQKNIFPLNKIADKNQFWDLGVDFSVEICAEKFLKTYNSLSKTKLEKVILIDTKTINTLLSLVFNKNENWFTKVSREVANIDRHNKIGLQQRKNTLQILGHKFLSKLWKSPFIWRKVSELLATKIFQGEIWMKEFSQESIPTENSWSIIEWNLGGGKSSRYLDKQLQLNLREISPKKWQISLEFSAENLAQWDEPIGQDWQGVFEVLLPNFLSVENHLWWETSIPVGEKFQKKLTFESLNLDLKDLEILVARSQNINTRINISLFPQQEITKVIPAKNSEITDGIVRWQKVLNHGKHIFSWEKNTEKITPFLVFYEIIKHEEKTMQVELHWNEQVKLQSNFSIKIIDTNFTNSAINSNPVINDYKLLPDKRSMVLNLSANSFQTDERYKLEIDGVEDLWGNKMNDKTYTLIDSFKFE